MIGAEARATARVAPTRGAWISFAWLLNCKSSTVVLACAFRIRFRRTARCSMMNGANSSPRITSWSAWPGWSSRHAWCLPRG